MGAKATEVGAGRDPVGRDASTVAPDRGHSFRNMRALRPVRHSLATTAGGGIVGGRGRRMTREVEKGTLQPCKHPWAPPMGA